MDSFVVLPACSASNGFTTPSASSLLCPTLNSVLSSSEVREAVDPATTRSSVDDVLTSSSTDGRGPSTGSHSEFSPSALDLRHPADTCRTADNGTVTTTTNGDRAQLLRERQRAAWDEMHGRMERRRREWNAQVDRMRTDFFKLKPSTSSSDDASDSTTVATADSRQQRVVHVEPSWAPTTVTRQQFQVITSISPR